MWFLLSHKGVIVITHIYIFFIYKMYVQFIVQIMLNKGNNKITELRTILQRESQNS